MRFALKVRAERIKKNGVRKLQLVANEKYVQTPHHTAWSRNWKQFLRVPVCAKRGWNWNTSRGRARAERQRRPSVCVSRYYCKKQGRVWRARVCGQGFRTRGADCSELWLARNNCCLRAHAKPHCAARFRQPPLSSFPLFSFHWISMKRGLYNFCNKCLHSCKIK